VHSEAAADDGIVSPASCCSSAAEQLLPKLARQGVNLAAFLQPMVQMVASLSAARDNGTSSAEAAAAQLQAGRVGTAALAGFDEVGAAPAASHAAVTALAGAGRGRQLMNSMVSLFPAKEQPVAAAAGWSAAAAHGNASRRAAAPASTAAAAAAAGHDAARWHQAHALQQQGSSSLMAVLSRVMAAHGPDAAATSTQPKQQQQQVEDGPLQHDEQQPAVVPASPKMQQQQLVALQQGSWMSSSSSSAASSSAAGGAALGGLMSPTASIAGFLLSPAQAATQQQQQMKAVVASHSSRPWQCSSSAVPSISYVAGASGATLCEAAAASTAVRGQNSPLQQGYEAADRAAGLRVVQPSAAAVQHAVRTAPGPSDSQVINQHRQHVLKLEQTLGNMHPQVRQSGWRVVGTEELKLV
jgi:hypothetical protein